MLYENELSVKGYDVISTGDGSRVIDIIDQESPNLEEMISINNILEKQ